MKNESGFKTLTTQVFDNVKIRGMFETEMKPITMILNVNFSLFFKPESFKQDKFELTSKIKKQLGLFSIDRECKDLKFEDWKYDGSRFTYEHSIEAIKPNKGAVSLGLDLYFVREGENDIQSFYKEVCEKISKFSSFKSNDLFKVKSHRKWRKKSK